jgi:hypothetical protein
MTVEELFQEWLELVATVLSGAAGRRWSDPNALMTTLPIAEAVRARATAADLSDLVLKVFREYSFAASKAGERGWFYAWVDELSGTLRFAAASVRDAKHLPFACKVDLHANPGAIADVALRSRYAQGIPKAELEAVAWIAPGADTTAFVLPVFARELVHAA